MQGGGAGPRERALGNAARASPGAAGPGLTRADKGERAGSPGPPAWTLFQGQRTSVGVPPWGQRE